MDIRSCGEKKKENIVSYRRRSKHSPKLLLHSYYSMRDLKAISNTLFLQKIKYINLSYNKNNIIGVLNNTVK